MTNSKKICLAALICGILGLVGIWLPVVNNVNGLLAIAAIILGSKGLKDAGATADEKNFAKIGRILGIVGIVVTIAIYIYTFVLIASMM